MWRKTKCLVHNLRRHIALLEQHYYIVNDLIAINMVCNKFGINES